MTSVKEKKSAPNKGEVEYWLANWGAYATLLYAFALGQVFTAVWGVWLIVWKYPPSTKLLKVTFSIARATGRMISLDAALLLLTTCKSFITALRGTSAALYFPFDSLMPGFHIVVAVTIFIAAIIHTVAQIVSYASGDLPLWIDSLWASSFGGTLPTTQLFVTGILLDVFLFALFALSHPRIRASKAISWGYELFYSSHTSLAFVIFVLLIIHGTFRGRPKTWEFLIGPAMLFVADLIHRKVFNRQRPVNVRVKSLRRVDTGDKIVRLELEKPFHFLPGQYALIRVPEVSAFQVHPFTIGSAPEDEMMVFYIAGVGWWTKQLLRIADEASDWESDLHGAPSQIKVDIMGPFGAPSQDVRLFRYLVLLSAGVGVTPMLSVLRHLDKNMAAQGGEQGVDNPFRGSTEEIQRKRRQLASSMGIDKQEVLAKRQVRAIVVMRWLRQLSTLYPFLWVELLILVVTGLVALFDPFSPARDLPIQGLWHGVVAIRYTVELVCAIIAYGRAAFRSWQVWLTLGIMAVGWANFVLAVLLMLVLLGEDEARVWSKVLVLVLTTFVIVSTIASIVNMIETEVGLHSLRHIYPGLSRRSQLPPSPEYVRFVWVVKSLQSLWCFEELKEVAERRPWPIEVYMTQEREDNVPNSLRQQLPANFRLIPGRRPDWESILDTAVSDSTALLRGRQQDSEVVGTFFCGPPAPGRQIASATRAVMTRLNQEPFSKTEPVVNVVYKQEAF